MSNFTWEILKYITPLLLVGAYIYVDEKIRTRKRARELQAEDLRRRKDLLERLGHPQP